VGSLEGKVACAREFAKVLAERLRGRLCGVVLFGSVAKGSADEGSDVDVLVVVDRVTDEVEEIVAEAAFEVSLRSREPVEYVVMGLEEYRAKLSGNPLIYEVERYGEELYRDPKPEEEMVGRLVELAEEYYGYAVRCAQQLMHRAALRSSGRGRQRHRAEAVQGAGGKEQGQVRPRVRSDGGRREQRAPSVQGAQGDRPRNPGEAQSRGGKGGLGRRGRGVLGKKGEAGKGTVGTYAVSAAAYACLTLKG
jgi:predicted nucleotidyltransferase